VAAGLARVPYGQFLAINFGATLPKTLLLLLIGFYFGRNYTKIANYLDYTAMITVALVIFVIILYVLLKAVSKRFFDSI